MRKITVCCLAAFFICGVNPVFAGGGQSYPNGAEAFMSGAVPPPGFYFLNYLNYYSADEMKDNNGDDVEAFDELSVWANVFRFLWVSEQEILGANLCMHTFIPVLDVDIDFKSPVGPKTKNHTATVGFPM